MHHQPAGRRNLPLHRPRCHLRRKRHGHLRVREETPTEVRFDLDEEENTLTITFFTDEGYYHTDASQPELEYGYYLRTVTIRNVGTTEIDVDSIISAMTGAAAE